MNYFSGWVDIPDFLLNRKDATQFCFQEYENRDRYCGINIRIFASHYTATGGGGGWILKPKIYVQYLFIDTDKDLNDISIGSEEPSKLLYLNNYGKKKSGWKWEEITYSINDHYGIPGTGGATEGESWLIQTKDENYNYIAYANDLAQFSLSQSNRLTTNAQITLLLDAYEYYDLSFQNLINLTNTLNATIYNDNNGFPLNIENISINCANRTVTLNLTNYNKTFYERTGNYLANYSPIETKFLYSVQDVLKITFSQGL